MHVRRYIAADIVELSEGEVISDGCARAIASIWYESRRTPLYVLESTGAIRGDVAQEIADLSNEFRDGLTAIDQAELTALSDYVARHGERGPVDGWLELWVRVR